MIIYYVLFLSILFLSIFDTKFDKNTKVTVLLIVAIVMVSFAGLRGENVDRDYSVYLDYFKKLPDIRMFFLEHEKFLESVSFEPSFILIFSSTKLLFNNGFAVAIFLYAFLGVALKFNTILKISDYPIYSVLLYFSTIFLLQDMTQIRVGVALGFVFLALIASVERQLTKYIIFILIGLFFHYSIIFFSVAYFLNSERINKKVYYLMIVIPIILYSIGFNPLDILLKFQLGVYTEKLQAYVEMQSWQKAKMNMFNFSIIFQIVLCVIFIQKSEKSSNKYFVLFTKLFTFGISAFYILSFSPVIAFRTSELLTSVQIFLLPMLIPTFKHKSIAEILIILFASLHFFNQIVVNKIFNDYSFIFS